MIDTFVTAVMAERYTVADTPARYAYLRKGSSIRGATKTTSLRVSRAVSGFVKDTPMRKVVAQNQLRNLYQTQDYLTRDTREPPVHQTEIRDSQPEDFLDWFDKAWDKAEIWKFDDSWREFDDSWGRYTEQRLLFRVR